MHKLFFILLFGVLIPHSVIGQQGESAVNLFMKGEQYRKANNLQAAIQHYDLAIKKDPNSHIYYFQKGQCCMLLRNYNCAIKSFEEASRLKHNNVEAYTRLSWLYEQTKKPLASIKHLDNAYKHQVDIKKRIEYKMKIITTLYRLGQFKKAGVHIQDVKSIISERHPKYLDVLYYDAKYKNLVKQYTQAKSSMLQALRKLESVDSKTIARFYYELGYAYYHLKEYRNARSAFNYANYGEFRALIAKMTPEYNFVMANAYYSAYMYKESKELLLLCLSLDKDYSKARELLKVVNNHIENFNAIALRLPLAKSEENLARKAARFQEVAEYQLGAGKFRDALVNVEKCLELQPRRAKASILKGVLLYHLKQYEESKITLRSIAKSSGVSSEDRSAANFAMGILSKNIGEKRNAIVYFKAATFGNFKYASDKELNDLL